VREAKLFVRVGTELVVGGKVYQRLSSWVEVGCSRQDTPQLVSHIWTVSVFFLIVVFVVNIFVVPTIFGPGAPFGGSHLIEYAEDSGGVQIGLPATSAP